VTEENEADYGTLAHSVTDKKELVLSIQACRDASIALSEIPGIYTHRSYELVIGADGNTYTSLRNGTDPTKILFQSETLNILDCLIPRQFWLSWNKNTLSFGKGTIPEQNRILYYRDVNIHTINAISIRTPLSVRGVWAFYSFTGKCSCHLLY